MSGWKSLLNVDSSDWHLEETHPSDRDFALRWLFDLPEDDPEVESAQRSINRSDPIQKLLAHQHADGYWRSDPRQHHGTQPNLLFLMWLGYRGNGVIKKSLDCRITGCLLNDRGYGFELKGRIVKLPYNLMPLKGGSDSRLKTSRWIGPSARSALISPGVLPRRSAQGVMVRGRSMNYKRIHSHLPVS